jgi:hypothetical protein
MLMWINKNRTTRRKELTFQAFNTALLRSLVNSNLNARFRDTRSDGSSHQINLFLNCEKHNQRLEETKTQGDSSFFTHTPEFDDSLIVDPFNICSKGSLTNYRVISKLYVVLCLDIYMQPKCKRQLKYSRHLLLQENSLDELFVL